MRLTLVYDGESKGSSHIVDADTGERLEKVESFTLVRGEGSGRDKLTLTVALPTGLEGDRARIASIAENTGPTIETISQQDGPPPA